jgi:hypothetical protein
MSARVWTREELDRLHPLPEGWEWYLFLKHHAAMLRRGTVQP